MKQYEEKWVVIHKPGNVSDIMKRFGISDVFARILWNRGYQNDSDIKEFLFPDDNTVIPEPEHAEEWVTAIRKEIDSAKKFRVIGDYDVDGVTATYLMVRALRTLGADADYRIPDRIADGYGISMEMVRCAAEDGIDVLITVDNGIAAIEQIDLANQLGMKVFVTDHHEPQERLPQAVCIVDPKCSEGERRVENLCGAVIAGYLADRLLESYGMDGYWKENSEIMALASVCDVMPLNGATRSLVRQGLKKPLPKWNEGLKHLAYANQLKEVLCYQLGFVLGPCINALGRLETADYGVELLLSKDSSMLHEYSQKMVDVNAERKKQTVFFTEQGRQEAKRMISEQQGDTVLVVYLPDCHESLAGIVAGRIREEFNRPTFVLVDSITEPDCVKGSGRSIEGFSMFEAMMECKDLFVKFGGHAMAAGATMKRDRMPAFRESLCRSFQAQNASVVRKYAIDLVMPFRYITGTLLDELALMEPFGTGNPKPVFAQKNVQIVHVGYLGKNSQYLSFTMKDLEQTEIRCVYFGNAGEFVDEMVSVYGEDAVDEAFSGYGNILLDILYFPERNSFNNRETLQIAMTGYHFSGIVI